MKNGKSILLVAAMMLSMVSVKAQVIEIITTHNGSEYEGYLSEQDMTSGKWEIYAEKAVIYVNQDDLSNKKEVVREFCSLPCGMKKYLREKNEADTVFAKLYTVNINGETFDNVIIEKGKNKNQQKVYNFYPRTYKLDVSEIESVCKAEVEYIPYGIKAKVLTESAELREGIVTCQQIGKRLDIADENGSYSIKNSDLLSVRYEQIDPEVSIFEQSQLLDRIVLKKNHGENVGIIVARKFGTEEISFLPLNASEVIDIPMDNIKAYQKVLNTTYKPYKEEVDTTHFVQFEGKEFIYDETLQLGNLTFVLTNNNEFAFSLAQARRGLKIVAHNTEVGDMVEIFPMTEMKYTDKTNKALYKKVVPCYDEEDSQTISFYRNSIGEMEAKVILKKAGQYFVQINGEEGFVITVKEQSSNNTKKKKK